MKKTWLAISVIFLSAQIGFGQIISQYIETDSGTQPKGIEIWNNTVSTLDFSVNNLVIEKGTNGGTPAVDFTLSSGSLTSGSVIVIGTDTLENVTIANGATFYLEPFTFNGDDALVVKYGGVTTDVFGEPGVDPGSSWNGNGVSTANQNIQLKIGITSGDVDGWTDPSARFEIVNTAPSATGGEIGFGLAPYIYPEPTNHTTNFTAIADGSSQINLTWTDATGSQLPSGYLIKSSTVNYTAITDPVDEVPEMNDMDVSDGSGVVNVSYGVELYNWIGLSGSTDYYYKIYPYTNSGSDINYKTTGLIPDANETTGTTPTTPKLVISEIIQDPNDVSDANGEWFEIYNSELTMVNINGYTILDDGTDNHVITNGGALNIPAGGFIVLGRNSNSITNGGLTVDYEYSSFTLANGADEVILLYTDGTTVVDEVWYDDGTTFPDPTGASMILIDMTIDNSLGANWITSTIREGSFDAVGTDLGSPGVLGSEAALPVEITSFTAIALDKGARLDWETATEVNNYGFEIERSVSETWEKIGFIEGHGNSNSPKVYSFIDESPLFGEISYRLKQLDTDGAYEYSDVATVVSATLAKYELHQNHPNPFNPSTNISFTVPDVTRVKVVVYNALGQKVSELLNQQVDAGYHKVDFDGSNLSSGMYFYRLETPNYSKTMKMMLIK